ncbi:hypothetical protein AB0L71_28110 [Streptomyces sp. NPDC052052]|uniref:hypothetical protein n=1 Tax=Streptomyces sp. NPDC052052 TaxID=3154756 RepID=UPI00341FF90D
MTVQQTTAWPEGVIARYLTVGGATVDIAYTDDLHAVCQGERCPWRESEYLEVFYTDSVEVRDQKIDNALPSAQRRAQAHAETCRAMPKPTA